MNRNSPNLDPEEKLFLAISQAYQLSRKLAEDVLDQHRITLAQYNLLRIVENRPGITARDAREHFSMTAPSMTQLTQNLEAKNLLAREEDPDDKRVYHLTLTSQGRSLTSAVRRTLHGKTRALLGKPSMLKSTVSSLNDLIAHLTLSPSLQ